MTHASVAGEVPHPCGLADLFRNLGIVFIQTLGNPAFPSIQEVWRDR